MVSLRRTSFTHSIQILNQIHMKIDQVQLYTKKYKGIKIAFNSRKGLGKIIQGIATQVVPQYDVVILRDSDNFPHCISILTLEEI